MKKSLLKITVLSLLLALHSPILVASEMYPEPVAEIENEINEVQITVSNGNIVYVKNAEGALIEVYNITGAQILSQRVESNCKIYEISNLQKGCYIVKVGKVTRKIFIK
jgi:hypothetical protein